MRTPSSSASRIGAALAVSVAAALAAASGPARAEGGDARPAPTSSTCRICHTDPAFGASFSHRGLEESADGCLSCHADPAAHVKARGGRGNVPVPPKMAAAAERELCLQCHEEETYAAPKHLEPKGKDARCTACHVLHGAALPERAKSGPPAPKPGPGGKPAAPPVGAVPPSGAVPPAGPVPPDGRAAPAPEPARIAGRVEAGWRFVGNEEGRYFQDLGLDDGPRLFSLEARTESGDPLAARGELAIEGLGDPHEWARFRARRGDLWKASVDARRDELPFLGQNGLHGGETSRSNFSAAVDLRLSSVARLGLGYDRADVEGDIQGTLLDNGVVKPVAVGQDRLAQEGNATLDLRGKAWHARIRQGWLTEDGDDERDRDESAPGAPDVVAYDDESTMDGPLTFVAFGGETLEGRLSFEARASRADLTRDVDTVEARRSDLSGTYSLYAVTSGRRDRLVESQALDAALAFGEAWAFEASFDRRTLREDGTVTGRTSTTTSAGTSVKTTSAEDRVSQRVLEERVGVRRTLGRGFHLRGGAEWIQDSLDHYDSSASGKVRTSGFFAGVEGEVTPEVRVRGEARTAHGTDVFTPLTPTDRDAFKVGASYRDAEGTRGGVDWGLSDTESAGRTAASRGWGLRLWGGIGAAEEATLDAGWTVRNLTLSVDTLSYIGSSLSAGESVSKVRSHVLDFGIGIPLAARFRLVVGGNWALDNGTLPLRAFDATAGIRWQISPAVAARLEYRRREYDEFGNDVLDYEADILEVAVEMGF